jgi:hypothetical protein
MFSGLFSHHACSALTKLSTSLTVLPACKQILTRSVPCGTVGDTTALTIMPLPWRYPARSLGRLSCIAKIGDCGQALGMLSKLLAAAEAMCSCCRALNRNSVR